MDFLLSLGNAILMPHKDQEYAENRVKHLSRQYGQGMINTLDLIDIFVQAGQTVYIYRPTV